MVFLRRYTFFTACATWLLILAGGMVTSTGSGLAVPDWPLSYGKIMPPMIGGIFYEHGHRMIAATVGFLTFLQALWISKAEKRKWVKQLAWSAFATVSIQGIFGGITVLFLLPPPVSIAHATLAQIFFCLMISLALVTSPLWEKRCDVSRNASLRLAVLLFGAIFLQLILGAAVRHLKATLVIPDFPFSFGGLLPNFDHLTFDPSAPFPASLRELKLKVVLQFTHRLWGMLIFAGTLTQAISLQQRGAKGFLAFFSKGMVLLVSLQVLLGGTIIWTKRAPLIATAHVGIGALLLALSLIILLLIKKNRRNRSVARS